MLPSSHHSLTASHLSVKICVTASFHKRCTKFDRLLSLRRPYIMSELYSSTPSTGGPADHGDGELPTDQRPRVSSLLTSSILPEMTAVDRQEMGIDSPSTDNDVDQTNVSMLTAIMSELRTSSDDLQSVYVTKVRRGTPTVETRAAYEFAHSEDESENGNAVLRNQADGPSTGSGPNRRRRVARHTNKHGENPTPLSNHLPQDDSATPEQWASDWDDQRGRRGEHGRTSFAGNSTQATYPHPPSNSPLKIHGLNRRAPRPVPSLTRMSSSDREAFFNEFGGEGQNGEGPNGGSA